MSSFDEEKIQELYSECQELKRKINVLEWTHIDEVDELKREIDKERKLNKDFNAKYNELKVKLNERVDLTLYNDLEQRYSEEIDKFAKILEINERLEMDLSNKNEEMKSLQQLINDKNKDLDNFRKTIKEFVQELAKFENLEEELTSAKQTIEQLQEKNANLNSEINMLMNSVQLNTSINRKSRSSESFRMSLSVQGENIGFILLEERIKELEEEKEKLQLQLDDNNKKLESFNEEIKLNYEEKINQLKSHNEQLKLEIDELSKHITKLELDLKDKNEIINNLQINLDEKNKELKDVTVKSTSTLNKLKDFDKQFNNRITFMQARLNEKRLQLSEKESMVNQLQSSLDANTLRVDELNRQISSLQQECKINEDSFYLERIHKERYLRDVNILKAELETYKASYNNNNRYTDITGNPVTMTFVLPTIHVKNPQKNHDMMDTLSNAAKSNSLINENYTESIISSRTMSSSMVTGFGSNFTIADEESEFMDPKNLESLKSGQPIINNQIVDEDRLSILQRRNTMVPSHLKSSYPIEYQNFKSKENISEETIKKGTYQSSSNKMTTNERRNTILHGIENSTYRSIEYKNSNSNFNSISTKTNKIETLNKNKSSNKSSGVVASHFILSCTPTKILKRVRNHQKWTPSKENK